MKKLPETNVGFNELYRILSGPIRWKLLLTGIELRVFNQLIEPKSAEAIAGAINTHPENTRLFLDGLAASDLLVKKNGLYQNASVTQAYLVESSPTYLGQLFIYHVQMSHCGLDKMTKLVKEGPLAPDPEANMYAEKVWAQGASLMANGQRTGMAQQAAKIVSQLPEFLSFRKMLDLGGGPGLIGIAIVASHPSMKGVIFDQKAVVEVAENFIKEYKMEDRMGVLAGDYNHDSIGEGYDLIWASATLNSAKDNLDSLMQKSYSALNPGGIFISCAEGLTHERTRPDIHVLNMLSLSLMGQNVWFDQGVVAGSILRVGFRSVRSRTLDTDWGPMDLDIGMKAK